MTSPSRFVALGSFLFVLPLLAAAGCGDSGHDVGSTGAGGSAGAAGTAGAGRGGATGGSGGRGGDAAAGTGGATGGAIAGSGGGAGTGTGGNASGGRGGSGATGGAIAGSGGGAGRGGTGGGGGRGGAGGGGGRGGASGAGGTGGTGGAVCGGSPGILCTVELVCDIDNPNKCGSGSVTGHCISLLGGCTTDVNPVCGCNGQTYSNDCERAHARVQLDHAGACVPSSCASCNVATTYCQVTMGGAVGNPPSYACPALPAGCGTTPSCACLPGCGGGCTTGAGGILTVTCLVP